MRLKDLILLLTPPAFIILKDKLLNSKRPKESNPSTIKNIEKKSDVLIVIGNGPSLNDTIKEHKEEIINKDCVVVNSFCNTVYYEELKPNYYLLADPAYFGDVEKFDTRLKNLVTGTWDAILRKTTWDINLIVPSYAKGSAIIGAISNNSHISVYFYNIKDLRCNKMNKFEAWDLNLIPPPAQTCLNTCVWLGICLRFKSVYLIGADTTWLELLHVDQETNEVYTIDSHFYGKKKDILYSDVEGKIPQKLHDELNCISWALKRYWDLKDYAEYAGVKIYNASKYSLIDAFERKKDIR